MLSFKWRHFKRKIILMLVRWYLAYPLSYREIEELALVHHMLRKNQPQQSESMTIFEQFYALAAKYAQNFCDTTKL